MKLLKQYHYDHALRPSDQIDIIWDIFNMCNYHCTYCYMRLTDRNWNKLGNWKLQQDIIKTFEKTEVPITVWLLGGEPTMHPKFTELVTELHAALSKSGTQFKIKIISNNTKPEKLCNLPENIKDALEVVLSFHAEEADTTTFFKNIELLQAANISSITVDIMMHFDKQYKDKVLEAYSIATSTSKIHVSISFMQFNQRIVNYHDLVYSDYKEKFEQAPKPFIFVYDTDTVAYSDMLLYNVINDGKTNFNGMNCNITRFMMDINGNVTRSCLSDKFELDKIIQKQFSHTVVCPKSSCTSDCNLNFVKWK